MDQKKAIIIGAGPAGLTAAYELLTRTGIKPIVLEKSDLHGRHLPHGELQGQPHRHRRPSLFFQIRPRDGVVAEDASARAPRTAEIAPFKYHRMERTIATPHPAPTRLSADRVMLLRPRKSRIYYLRRFFDYPISLSKDTLLKLGCLAHLQDRHELPSSALFPLKKEETLEQFFINRFGRELYGTFFKSYTEKVWGVPCDQISAEWGAQRIKGLSIWSTLARVKHALTQMRRDARSRFGQKGTETSLIEQFLYPKFGPGQMWEEVARRIQEMGGEIHTGYRVERLITDGWTCHRR